MGAIILPTTSARTSSPFVVQRGETVGVCADGLAGAETAVIQRQTATGSFVALTSGGTLTATANEITISASGTYQVAKDASVSASSVRID